MSPIVKNWPKQFPMARTTVSCAILWLACVIGTGSLTRQVAGTPTMSGSFSSARTSPSRTVTTRYGRVLGSILTLPHPLQPVEVYLGLPYATPPVGVNRFSPTRNPVPWTGVRLADTHGPVCPQHFPDLRNESQVLKTMPRSRLEYLRRLELLLSGNQSEDCLYLNIYAPAQGRPPELLEKLPVLVYIHGESFEWNSGNVYDGSVLASYANMVVVTLNFRLGVLGFLNIARAGPKGKARLANYGLMDQIAALHWIQENIAEFGGDSDRVTLAGHGTGAACVHFLMTSPTVVPGLFHRAILMSGSGLSSWALVDNPYAVAAQVTQAAGCPSSSSSSASSSSGNPSSSGTSTGNSNSDMDPESALNCLRETPLDRLLSAAAQVTLDPFKPRFGPTIDGVVVRSGGNSGTGGSGGSNPRKRSEGIERPHYDCLFGTSSTEAAFQLSSEALDYGMELRHRDQILRHFVASSYRYHQTEIFLTVANEYTDWEKNVQHPVNVRDLTIEALTDAQFTAPAMATADWLSGTHSNAYFYYLDVVSKDGSISQRQGMLHGLEVAFLFGAPLLGGLTPFGRNFTKQDSVFSEAIITLFSNFAKAGNPNEPQDGTLRLSKERNRFKNLLWETYDSVQRKYLEIGTKLRMRSHLRAHRMAVWLQLVPELQRTGQDNVLPGHGLLTEYVQDKNGSLAWANGSYIDPFHQYSQPDSAESASSSMAVTCATAMGPVRLATDSAGIILSTGDVLAVENSPAHSNSYPAAVQPDPASAYSTALSVTIAIGCSLLILNVLTFAGLYYRRDRRRQALSKDFHRSFSESLTSTSAGRLAGSHRTSTSAALEMEACFVQTPSCNGTLKKSVGGGSSSRNVRCCEEGDAMLRLSHPDLALPLPCSRSTLDIRYDETMPLPPDKGFL